MFGAVVCPVGGSSSPVESKLALDHTATKPMVSHVHCFKLLWNDGIVGEAGGGGVVGLNRSSWLGPIHFHECVSKWNECFGCDEEATKFRLGCRGHNEFNDLGDCKDGAIHAGNWVVFREEYVSTHAAASFADVKVGSVSVGGSNHLAGSIDNAIVGIGGYIVEELVDGERGGFGGGGLFGADGVHGNQELVVDSAAVEEQSANDALDASYAGFVERRTGVDLGSKLRFGAIRDGHVFVRRELAFGRLRVIVTIEDCLDISGDGEATRSLNVIPFEGDASKFGTSPILSDSVVLLENVA